MNDIYLLFTLQKEEFELRLYLKIQSSLLNKWKNMNNVCAYITYIMAKVWYCICKKKGNNNCNCIWDNNTTMLEMKIPVKLTLRWWYGSRILNNKFNNMFRIEATFQFFFTKKKEKWIVFFKRVCMTVSSQSVFVSLEHLLTCGINIEIVLLKWT